MAAPYTYAPLVEPRHIRLLQVWLDEDEMRHLDYGIMRAREVGKQLGLGNERSPYAVDEREFQEFKQHVTSPISIHGRLVTASLDNPPSSYTAIS